MTKDTIKNHRFCRFCYFLWQRANQHELPNTAASLTLSTLTALVPTLTFLFFLFSRTHVFQVYALDLSNYVASFLEIDAFNSIKDYVRTLPRKIGSLSVLGAVILLISATFLMLTIENSFNKIWQVEKPRQLWQRLLVNIFILLIVPFTLVILVSWWSFYIKALLVLGNVRAPFFTAAGYLFFSFGLYIAIIFVIFRFVPYCYVPSKDAFIGAVITTAGLIALKKIFSFYVLKFNNYELIYGAFAAVPLFILYIYLLWYTLLIGALITSGWSSLKNNAFIKAQGCANQFEDAVRVLSCLTDTFAADGYKIQELYQKIRIGYDDLSGLMQRLGVLGYVEKKFFSWRLKQPPQKITLVSLYHDLVLPLTPQQKDVCGLTLYDLLNKNNAALALNLREFLTLQHEFTPQNRPRT